MPDGAHEDLPNTHSIITAVVGYYQHTTRLRSNHRLGVRVQYACVGIIFRSPIRGGRRRSSCLLALSFCLRARSLFSPTLSLDHSHSLSLARSLALSPSSPPSHILSIAPSQSVFSSLRSHAEDAILGHP